MFNLELKIPTYAEWKAQLEKLKQEQPEQAEKYYEQVQKFWQDFFEDMFKIKKQFRLNGQEKKGERYSGNIKG